MEFLDFKAISNAVPFKKMLDHFNIAYEEVEGQLKGEGFVVSLEKNLYFNPKGADKGSIINFLARHMDIELREAAKAIKNHFLVKKEEVEEKKIPEYDLKYDHPFLKEKGIAPEQAEEFEMGYYSQRGIMAGKIAIKIRDKTGEKIGYVGRNIKDNAKGKYFFFKGYKSEHIYNLHTVKGNSCILTVSPFHVVTLHAQGYKNAVALVAHSMTEAQEELLKQFDEILLLHPKPDNILKRLSRFAFVKAPDEPLNIS